MEPRGYRNNNPLNIKLSKGPRWSGEVRPSQDEKYCQFEDMAHGYRAAFKLLDNYRKNSGCVTLADFINRWAPPKENDTNSYVMTVAKRCNMTPGTKVNTKNSTMMRKIVAAMSVVENGIEPNAEDIYQGWLLFNIP